MATPYQLPSSFSGGMQGAIDSLKRGQLPQSIMSPVKDSSKVKQTILPKKNVPKKWTVKIDDGSTLQFDNEPTPQDIEEAFAQMKAPQPKAPIFQDKYAGEGSVMQTLKALPRAALETGKQVVGNLQGAFESGSNVINSGVSSAYKGVTGRQLPGFGTAESGFTEQKQKFDVPSNLAQFGASATGLATQATPVGLSTNLGFNLAAELPGVQYAPQAIGAGIQGASNIVSDVTGISPEITQNLTTTALNTLFLRSAGKQSAPISQAYAKSGQLGALKELGMSVPRTTVDIAKQPIQAVIGTAKIPFKIADWAIGKTAQGLLTNKTGTQELFQASSPSINKIGNKSLGLDKLREKSAIADETIVKLGYRPKNTTERAEAYQSAMGDIWNQIEQVRGGVSEKFSGKQLGAYLRDRIEKSKVNGKLSPSQQRDANTLNDWATYYESLGDFDTPTLSGIRTQINGETTWNKKLDNGDLFNKTFQDLAAVVRKTENNVIDSAKGGQFQDLMNRYGALTTLLEDVIKQDIKLQRAKGEGLTTTYSRIEGIGDVLKGGIGLIKEPVTGLSNIASGLGKLAVGKTLAKLKDTDFLIENGYNKLYKSLGLDKGKGKLPTKKVYQEPEGLKPIQESSNIPKSSPVNNTQKEASKATLPKVEQKQTEVSKSVLPGNKVNTPIIPKTEVKANLPKESKLPKKQDDWTKKDFTKTTESKSVDKYGNTIAREQGKTSAVDSITVGGKKYTNIDIPDSSRTLYELDGKIYEYKDGKMISEGANLPKTPQEGKTSETLLNEYDSIKKEIDSLRENAMKKIKNGEDTGDLIPRIKELQTKEESIYNEYKSKRNIEEGLDESNRKIESDKVIEDKKITEMKKSEETDLRGFTDNMSPMEKGKAISLLTNKRVMYKGKAMTLRDAFEKKLEDGWKLSDNGLIFRNPEYLSHTVDVGTPVNKTESAYIKYISKSDTPKTPQEGKTALLMAKKSNGVETIANEAKKYKTEAEFIDSLKKKMSSSILPDDFYPKKVQLPKDGGMGRAEALIKSTEERLAQSKKELGMARNKNRIAEIERIIKRQEVELQDKINDLNRYNTEKKAYSDALDKITNKDKVDAVIRNGKATESDRELLTFMLENRDKPVEFWTDIYKQSKPKPSPLSQKSEVKYSTPDTLVQEAKKYKSAEEFVKKNLSTDVKVGDKVFYRDGSGNFREGILTRIDGDSFNVKSPNIDVRGFNLGGDSKIDMNKLYGKITDENTAKLLREQSEVNNKMKFQIKDRENQKGTISFDDYKKMTDIKQQLTDIYNKANKK